MFLNPELKQLRLQKDLLVLEGDVRRLQLASDWQCVRSSGLWRAEAAQLARRHPVWTALLTVGAGVLLIQAFRRPGALAHWLSQLGGVSSTLFSAARIFLRQGRNA